MKSCRWGIAMMVAIGLMLWASPSGLRAQAVNATVLGTITDATGAVVPNSKVTITEVNTNLSRSTQTNESGNYTFPDVSPGRYDVSVARQGFKKAVRAAVDVLVNSTVRVDLTLQPGVVTETINVTAAAPLLQTDRADTGRKLETKQVEDLPLAFNRNFQNLLNLVPGTTRAFRPHSQFFNPQDSLSTQVNGQSRLANNLQFEGVDDNHRTGLLQVLIPPIEAIQSVDVTTSNYEAELGRAGGAVTNVMLKSGTNNIHGAAYEFYRSHALNARNFFDRGPESQPFERPATVYNYYGGNIGGPIRKNKTFFFGDFLRINDHRGQFWRFSVPTADLRTGDFRDPALTRIFDPNQGNPDGTGRPQISCGGVLNVICDNQIDPTAKKILALVPLPNAKLSAPGKERFTDNFVESTKFVKETTSFDVKIDHNQTEKDHLSGRFSFQKPTTTDPPAFGLAGGPIGGGFQGTSTQKTYSAAINYNHIFSPTFITELRFGINRYRNDAQQSDFGTKASDALGVPGVNVDAWTSGMTSIDLGSGWSNPLIGYSASLPWIRSETNINPVNTWTKTLSNHTVKWGVDIRRIRDDLLQTQTVNPRGRWDFRAGQTSLRGGPPNGFANNFASFLLGVPNFVGRDLAGLFPAYRATNFFVFGNDKWQVTPKLTLDLGLRWELYPPATPHFPGGFSNYDPNTNSLVLAGIGGNPINLGRETKYTNFAPRFGLAYRLTEQTVLRGGFGISYEDFPDNDYAYNFPVRLNNQFNNRGNDFGPALLSDGTPATFAKGFPPPLIATLPANGVIAIPPDPRNLLNDQFYWVINPNFKNPYVESWNVAVQRALPRNFSFEAAYVGNHGVDIATRYNLNAVRDPAFIGQGKNGQSLFQAFGRTAGADLLFVGTDSHYHALQVKFDHRSSNFLLTTAYTYGKATGYIDESGGFTYYINPRRTYSTLGFNRTHTFVQSYVYNLPFGKERAHFSTGWGSRLLGGWEISGILTLMSGTPLNFNCGSNNDKCPGFNTPGNSRAPNVNGPIKKLYGIDTGAWFDTAVFSQPPAATPGNLAAFGNVGRNILAGPGSFGLDAALLRKIALTEKVGLEVRAEAFSVTNTPQFGNPNTTIADKNFGLIKGAGGNRSMELGAKLTF